MKKKSQKEKVLEYLKEGNSITAVESYERGWGMRLASIIKILRNEGYYIKTKMLTNKYGTNYARYKLEKEHDGVYDDNKIKSSTSKQEEEKAKLLLKMKKYNSVKFGNDLDGNRYFKIGYWKPINSNDQYYVKQHSKLKFEEQSVWDDDCGYKYWYSIK